MISLQAKIWRGVALVLPLLGPLAPAWGGNLDGGPAFMDPSRTVSMPEEWHQRPITPPPGVGQVDLVVNLDQQIHHQLRPVVEEFASRNQVRIHLAEGTCGLSAGALVRKEADVVGFCCPPGDIDRLPGVRYHSLGIAAIALITHPANPLDNLTLQQAREIYRGQAYYWSEFKDAGGRAGHAIPITTIGRLHCKQRPGHWRLLLDNGDLFSPRMQEVGAIPDMISQVASIPGSLGYETLVNLMRYRDKGQVKLLHLNGFAPDDRKALASGLYPLYRAFYLTTWAGAPDWDKPLAHRLVEELRRVFATQGEEFGVVGVEELRKEGWRFHEDELVGGP